MPTPISLSIQVIYLLSEEAVAVLWVTFSGRCHCATCRPGAATTRGSCAPPSQTSSGPGPAWRSSHCCHDHGHPHQDHDDHDHEISPECRHRRQELQNPEFLPVASTRQTRREPSSGEGGLLLIVYHFIIFHQDISSSPSVLARIVFGGGKVRNVLRRIYLLTFRMSSGFWK